MQSAHLEEVAGFIRQHRSNESNFETLYKKLEEEAANAEADETYRSSLAEIKEKWAVEYRNRKEAGGSAWPEFEKFVSEFEKTVTGTKKEEQ